MPTLQQKALLVKIVLPEPAELRCSCKRIPSYEADTKRPNVSMCPGQLGILPGRGRKQISSSRVEDVATALVEASIQSPNGSVSVTVVSRVLDMKTRTQRFVQLLHLSSLLEWWLTSLGHGTLCGVTKPTFASMGTLTPTVVNFGQRKTLTLSRNNPCILTKLQYGVVLRLPLSLDRIFFEEITVNGIQTCSVIGQRCRDMLRDFVIPQLQQSRCLQDIIFKQDGVPPHINRRVKQLLRQHFTDARVISRHFPTAWPSRSPYITP
ncbi:hypothetical protein AVEN_250132-1 [Araneus ventricosus]|uniref:Uncharacterized protein n=1 Tax=Araneus ventricosus TaxID=182803 RepID=A0A4Y2L639_ARAVE|nr:hypothetical protein AVEN_250132-1 [Araneus ventricosus]